MGSTTHYRACNLCEAICGLEISNFSSVLPGMYSITMYAESDDSTTSYTAAMLGWCSCAATWASR